MADQSKLYSVGFDELAIKENVSYSSDPDEVGIFGDVGTCKYLASRGIYVEMFSI